jgi:hypothetical protein
VKENAADEKIGKNKLYGKNGQNFFFVKINDLGLLSKNS